MTDKTEPPGSASSSPDDLCCCGHPRRGHEQEQRGGGPSGAVYRTKCNRCFTHGAPPRMRWQHDFVPADAETAGEPECACGAEECEICTPMRHLAAEPEAPECAHIGSRTTASGDGPQGPWHDFKCDECGASWRRRWNSETRDWDGEPEATPEAEPPRRPPYAVAYATEDGTQYEVALPGDATIRAVDGALIITHASAVQALTMARPMEGA